MTRPAARELAIVGSVALIGQLDVWLISATDAGLGTQLLEAIGVLAFALLLPLRHRDPMAALVLMSSVGCLEALLVERRAFFFGQLIPYLMTVAATAGAARVRDRLRGLVVSYLAFVPLVALVPSLQGVGNVATYAVGIGAAWAIGLALGERAHRAESLAALAERRQEEAVQATQAERARLARELHDVVAHNVGVIVLHTVAASAAARDEAASAAIVAPLETIESTARETLEEMRRLVQVLDEHPDDASTGRVANLEPLLGRIRGAGLRVELVVAGEPRALPAAVDLSAYRIVQEALTNALKHAGAAPVRVELRYEPAALAIEVLDAGRGAATGASRGGKGLIGMRERVALLGGSFEAGPRAAGGFGVRAELPLAT